jgi:hypothetical protein
MKEAEHSRVPTPIPVYRKYAINVLGRLVGSQVRKHGSGISIMLRSVDFIASKVMTVPNVPLTVRQQKALAQYMQKTTFWHGAGRYQYKHGQKTDVLRYIIDHGALEPQLDRWDFDGPMTTISLAYSRMYARAYADMHGRGSFEVGRYGSSLFWAALFVGDMKAEGIVERKLWKPKAFRAELKRVGSNTEAWYQKMSQVPLSTMQAFHYGSDIEGNYPIIFGIRGNNIKPALTSRTVGLHEVRSSAPLSLKTDVVYIEVPSGKVDDVRKMLMGAKYEIPVVAIEEAELYVSSRPLSQLVSARLPN